MNVFRSLVALASLALVSSAPARVPIDLSGLASGSEITIHSAEGTELVSIQWPAGNGSARASLTLNLAPARPLFDALGWQTANGAPWTTIAEKLTPLTVLTVGERNLAINGWMVFFDRVHTRLSQRHPAQLRPMSLKATSNATRARITIEGLTAGAFAGRFEITVFAGSPLIMTEAVLSTAQDRRAILYDAGLISPSGNATGYAWIDPRTGPQTAPADTPGSVRAARFRTTALEFRRGSVTTFPPPHRFFYPLDFADNFGFNWIGRHYEHIAPGDGVGVRQPPAGDNRLVPWVNAPPGTEQRLPLFIRFGPESGAASIAAVTAFTRGDRFAPLAGHKVFTSHYHVEHTMELLAHQRAAGNESIPDRLREPGFVRAFRGLGIDIVQLSEFHFGTTPRLAVDERLRQLRLMHAECARLSDGEFLLLPGEEPNVHLGGHWSSFFPKPVLWVLNRPDGEPFVETNAAGETIYRVGSPEDVLELMRRENGLMWTSHPRIKGSIPFPDRYRDTAFFKAPQFLGVAWKAMPADYSRDTLGWRVFDVLDDMNNWGADKRTLGDVDVFRVEPWYELYGHMNVNYLKLDRLPQFADGWQSVLEVLRRGEYFVTTGEILASDFRVRSGESLILGAKLAWTLPLAFAELVGGDGTRVVRHRVDLSDTRAFGKLDFSGVFPAMPGLRWVRLAVWDVAGNGAFTQPVAIAPQRDP